MLFDAIVTILLGILIWAHWPMNSEWVVGTLFGISIFVSGFTRLMMSLAIRRIAGRAGRGVEAAFGQVSLAGYPKPKGFGSVVVALCVINRVGLQPVLIADGTHFFQGGAAHAGGQFARLPAQSEQEPNCAARDSVADCLGVAITTAGETRTDESGAGADCRQPRAPHAPNRSRPQTRAARGDGSRDRCVVLTLRVDQGTTVLQPTFHFSVRFHKSTPPTVVGVSTC